MRRQVPVLNIAQDPFGVSADSIPDDSENNHEQALAVTGSVLVQRWCTPIHTVYVLVAVCAVAGAVVGIGITVQYNQHANTPVIEPTCRSHNAMPPQAMAAAPYHPQTRPTSSQSIVVRLFALGSWSVAPSLADKKDGLYRYRDDVDGSAQARVASAMAITATQGPVPPQPKGTNHYLQLYLPTYIWPAHVDMMNANRNNFNWFGLLPSSTAASVATRVTDTFTSGYNQSALWSIPWAAIMGEHDVGGGNFLCGVSEATLHAYGNTSELVAGYPLNMDMINSRHFPSRQQHHLKGSITTCLPT
ncbi:hypothetical protein DYB38_001164 [Aphanomyces astaci]|uniref:Uncharacterized protein n=1 Tax=Aphanomyces astaci TaxID=112090 RepID=A0A397E867_APHAT|nr:hypothetical protein DYB34_003350 [Aphanomyces astaci]RHY74073.1 hypothetical protein DYB38_001164 [Aphanomyces astaci]RHY83270.1 hypothetical protein DYB31_000497 [Aphanomyces astaci]